MKPQTSTTSWTPLLHNHDATNILSIGNGATVLAVSQRVTFQHRGETLSGTIARIVLVSSGHSVHVRTTRGVFCLEPGDVCPKAEGAVGEPDAQSLAEDRRRMLHAQAMADLARLKREGGSHAEILAAEAVEEVSSYAE